MNGIRMEEYKREKGIRTDPSVVDMLQTMFEGIEPVISREAGGSEYHNELLEVIREFCNVKPDDIRIHDVYKNTEEYGALLKNI